MARSRRQRIHRAADIVAERRINGRRAKAGDNKHAVRMSSMRRRGPILLSAAAIGAVFVAGLFIHGWVGAALLVLTDAVLATMSIGTWSRVRPQGRPLRILVIAAVAVVAVIKIVHS
jgi:hypothetical protein